MALMASPVSDEAPPYIYLGDGGLIENSGALELLRRRTRYILVMEAGDDPNMDMITLTLLLKQVAEEKLCSFFVPGCLHMSVAEAIQEYQSDNERTFLHLGILYDWGEVDRAVGDIFWVQNRPAGPRDWAGWPQVKRFSPATCPLREIEMGKISPNTIRKNVPETALADEASPQPPMSSLQDCCWDGCCFPCGTFPNIETAQQFFSPRMAANFMQLGYHLTEEAVDALIKLRSEVIGGRSTEVLHTDFVGFSN